MTPTPLPLHALSPLAHPDRLFAIATLFGVRPRPVAGAEVLEMGAGSGANVVPLAAAYPDTRFVAEVQDEGEGAAIDAWRAALDLDNLVVRIEAQGESEERFDYILCPQAFGELEASARSQVLVRLSQRLAPHGIAQIGYPVLPGAYFERMTGEMMAFHAGQFADSAEGAAQGWAMLQFLTDAAQPEAYRTLLGHEAERLRSHPAALYEALRGQARHALYVRDFFALARGAGLQYLGEAPLSAMLPENFGDQVAKTLRRIGSDVQRSEQYIDFLTARRRRSSLLLHAGVALDRNLVGERLLALAVGAHLREDDQGRFFTPDGRDFQVRSPITRQVLRDLSAAWPRVVPVRELLADHELEPGAATAGTVLADLLRCYLLGAVTAWGQGVAVASGPAGKPLAWLPARRQAEICAGQDQVSVPSVLHESVALDAFTRYLLTRLDGTREREALLVDLEDAVANDILSLREGGEHVTDAGRRHELLGNALDQALAQFARAGLLRANQ